MPYVKGAKASKKPAAAKEPEREETDETDASDLDAPEEVVLTPAEKATKDKILTQISHLTPEVRGVLIDDIMEAYCSMCSEKLDEDGDCPEGCEPVDLEEEDEDEEDEGDEEEDDEKEEEETP